jgi:hypothetical protein
MMFWHNLQIKITTETDDKLRADNTFCGNMAIWEQETGGNRGKYQDPLGQYVGFTWVN